MKKLLKPILIIKESKMNCNLTIFTPTYNRAELLKKLYQSLINQSNKNFIWLIVDDGSVDNTEQVVNSFIEENVININYYKKTNGGKHSAIDLAHQICKTEFIACVDSDDYLTNNAIEEIYKDLTDVDSKCLGIVYRRAVNPNTPFNTSWPQSNTYLYFNELGQKHGYNEDTFLVFKTNIVNRYHFPKIEDERFITEKVLYNQFMFDYKILAVNKLLYIGEYQTDGYTANAAKLMFKNPLGTYYAFKSDTYHLTKYKVGLKKCLFAWARYFAWKKLNKYKDQFKNELNTKSIYRFLGWLISPIFYIRYKKKQKGLTKL